MRYIDRCLARTRTLAGECVVVRYEWYPQIRVRLGGTQ
jgi:hypothetical protein